MYAIVVTVAFQDMRHDEADKMLHDMVVHRLGLKTLLAGR